MPDRPATLHQRDRLDRAIELASGATAAGMFAYGVALSYSVLHAIARAAGLPPWAARLWPLGFEAFMASAALNALAEQRHRRHLTPWHLRVPWYPWTLTGLTAGASILLNWLHPAIPLDPPPGWLVSLVRAGRRRPTQGRAGPGAGRRAGRAARGRPCPARRRDPRAACDRPAGPGGDRAVPLPRLRRVARAARRAAQPQRPRAGPGARRHPQRRRGRGPVRPATR